MEYTVKSLSEIAGITPRTLRFYDQIGLLPPAYINPSNYRVYTQTQVDLLHQILFYREMGVALSEIKKIIYDKSYNPQTAMEEHRKELIRKRAWIDKMIEAADYALQSYKGEREMSNHEKFQIFKEKLVSDHMQKYGDEIIEKYGEDRVEASNRRMMNMSEEDYHKMNEINAKLMDCLKRIVQGEEKEEFYREAAMLHKQWLGYSWPEYSKEAHIGLVEMYLADERFKKYYEYGVGAGAAAILKKAVEAFADEV